MGERNRNRNRNELSWPAYDYEDIENSGRRNDGLDDEMRGRNWLRNYARGRGISNLDENRQESRGRGRGNVRYQPYVQTNKARSHA